MEKRDDEWWLSDELGEVECLHGTIGRTKSLCVVSCPSFGENQKSYFKVFSRDMEKMCRISMDNPEYLEGYGENMVLTEDEKNELIPFMHERAVRNIAKKDLSSWEYIIWSINHENESDILSYDMPIPDYSKLPTIN